MYSERDNTEAAEMENVETFDKNSPRIFKAKIFGDIKPIKEPAAIFQNFLLLNITTMNIKGYSLTEAAKPIKTALQKYLRLINK